MREPVDCPKCGRPYRADLLKECPRCGGGAAATGASPESRGGDSVVASSPSMRQSNFADARTSRQSDAARIATQSARIVNGYGTYIQVLGIIIGATIIVGGFILASQNNSITYGLIGLIVGALDLAFFAVQGALFRMISNYVIARLE